MAVLNPSHYRCMTLNSVSRRPVALISAKSRIYVLTDRNPVGLAASRSVGFSKRTVLIGRTGFDTTTSIPDLTLSLSDNIYADQQGGVNGHLFIFLVKVAVNSLGEPLFRLVFAA